MERRLGKGLGSLLGSDVQKVEQAPSRSVTRVPIAKVRPNPHQPRREFDPDGISELAASIRAHGVLQPVVVRAAGDSFELIAGERRWRAAREAGLEEIPATVREAPDEEMLELALVENVQRRDLDPIEKALGYRQMAERLGLTQEQIAEKVGLKRATIANHLRLLDLPQPAQEAVSKGLIQMGHARALASLSDPQLVQRLLARIVRDGLSVRETENLVRQSGSGRSAARGPSSVSSDTLRPHPPWVGALERRLRDALGVKASIHEAPGGGGRLVLEYGDPDELNRLVDRLAPKPKL